MKWLIDRLFVNWKTSSLGLAFLGFPMLAVFLGRASLTEAGIFLFVSLGGFLAKDKKK